MNKILAFCVVALILFSCESTKGYFTPKDFGAAAVKKINTKKFNSFKKLIVNKKDFEYLMSRTDFGSDIDKEKVVSSKNKRLELLNNQIRESFLANDLNDLRLMDVIYTIKKDGEIEFISNCLIVAKSGDKDVIILFKRLIKTENGWKTLADFSVEE